MDTYALSKARAELSSLLDKAIAGVPQRITRRGKEAVIVVSEADWNARRRSSTPTLGHLLAKWAEEAEMGDDFTDRPWKERELGVDLE